MRRAPLRMGHRSRQAETAWSLLVGASPSRDAPSRNRPVTHRCATATRSSPTSGSRATCSTAARRTQRRPGRPEARPLPADRRHPDQPPALIWVHGGSFSGGDKTNIVPVDVANTFAKMGYVVVSINYRLLGSGCVANPAGAPSRRSRPSTTPRPPSAGCARTRRPTGSTRPGSGSAASPPARSPRRSWGCTPTTRAAAAIPATVERRASCRSRAACQQGLFASTATRPASSSTEPPTAWWPRSGRCGGDRHAQGGRPGLARSPERRRARAVGAVPDALPRAGGLLPVRRSTWPTPTASRAAAARASDRQLQRMAEGAPAAADNPAVAQMLRSR